MADLIQIRAQLASLKARLAIETVKLNELESQLENAQGGDVPPVILLRLRAMVNAQRQVVAKLQEALNSAQAEYDTGVLADPMHAADPGLPLVLLPIRIETAYLPGTGGAVADLAIRVYPDDIHVDSHEPELTDVELAAGTAYWQAVWGAGSNTDRLNNAWNAVLQKLKPPRAAWAVDVLMPSVPRPTTETPLGQTQPVPPLPAVATRPGTFNRAARTTLLPDHWHFIGLRGGELFNVDGNPIPDSLNVSFGPPGTSANSSDLPFDDASRWLVDLDAAIAVGMAVRIPIQGANPNLDQLFVLGVSASVAPAEAASRLETTLLAHQYTNGLDFLPPGTPTNNTATTRSAWEAAPQPPTPGEVLTARASYAPASNQNAALAAKAIGIDGSQALCIAPNGLLDEQSDIATLQAQLWPVFGAQTLSLLYTKFDIPAGLPPSNGVWTLHADLPTAAALQEHAQGWVRSRGTLPVLRVSNQPYGLLPCSSLSDWVVAADDPTNPLISSLIGWLRVFRPYWLAAVLNVPRVLDGDPTPDQTIVNILSRQPVSESLMLRRDGDNFTPARAGAPLPLAPIPGIDMSSELFLAAPEDVAVPSPVPFVGDPTDDQRVLGLLRDLIGDSIGVLTGVITQEAWATKWGSLFGGGGSDPLSGVKPDLFTSMIKDSLTNPLLGNSGQVIGLIIAGALQFNINKDDPNFQKQVADSLPAANDLLARMTKLSTVSFAAYDPALRETMDIFSHRYDAWVTSLAARRLDQMRAAKPDGVVIGAYGWVENLSQRNLTVSPTPPVGFGPVFAGPDQTFIHAPSLHQAATAAVLRAGFESHQHRDALAVNLVSSRVRIADWLAEGIRNGQTMGALLGYRFERGLHENDLDGLIEGLRNRFPLPLPTADDGPVGADPARDAVAARNVVDGLQLYRQRVALSDEFAGTPQVGKLLNDLANAVDALGDMLLAESVHHLVGGNPLRAGLAADTIGRGESLPDRFDNVQTPRGGRALSWQLAALLPADFRSGLAGWNDDRPRVIAEPHVEAWLRTMLGPATLWKIQCSVTSGGAVTQVTVGLDALKLCALDVVFESSGSPSLLGLRVIDFASIGQPQDAAISVIGGPAQDNTLGFGELLDLTTRLRNLLAKSSALGPQHVQGPDSSAGLGLNVSELGTRVTALQSSLSNAVDQLKTAQQNLAAAGGSPSDLQTAVQALRSALIVIADHGIPSAYPPAAGSDAAQASNLLSSRAGAVLATVTPLAAKIPPAAPAVDASLPTIAQWFGDTSAYMQSVIGKATPITAAYSLPQPSVYAASVAPGAAPAGSDESGVMMWLRRIARVRPNALAVHDLLLASETMLGVSPAISVTQLPTKAGEPWVALPYPDSVPIPKARLSTVALTPAPIDGDADFCGLLFDNWTEHLPGLTSIASAGNGYEAAEVTGLSFKVDTPDAYPPQAILLAVAPDPSKGWSIDILLDVVQETLALAKIRSVDLGDLPRLGRVLPALHTTGNVDFLLEAAGLQP